MVTIPSLWLPILLSAVVVWVLLPRFSTARVPADFLAEPRELVAYREGPPGGPLRLRIVGYPGKVRLEHPTALLVSSGRRQWLLEDVTLENSKLAGDGRSAAAEFDLAPLLADLEQNRPLRLQLPGVFDELPVPPYVVAEWRSLPTHPG